MNGSWAEGTDYTNAEPNRDPFTIAPVLLSYVLFETKCKNNIFFVCVCLKHFMVIFSG